MNRTIKFRVWDKVSKLWVAGWSLGQLGTRSEENNYVWMQFTGLTDKNGKEIYEGDIYKSRLNTKFPYTLQVVRWDDLNQGFLPKMNYPEDSMGRSHHGEVIGNVWENPELLTK